ncbi:hypothetical protein WJX72_003520 [[Myrmecia] bisecta]|uniref:Translation initiation factor IF-3 n=1 Tax=[Myrmecia] bisecta TaxID=41462 RepID=A0AAW1PX89_9CHLO
MGNYRAETTVVGTAEESQCNGRLGGSRGGFQGSGPSRPRGGGGGVRGGRGGYQERDRSNDVLINDEINASEVRLIGEDKQMIGVVSLDQALDMADEAGVDVVMMSQDASPPVCRLMEYSKWKYEQEKNVKEARKKQREARQEVKELKLRPNTDVHDYQVRLRAAQNFLSKGMKVKLSLQFRGREMQFQELGRQMFDKFIEDLAETAQVEVRPAMQGRQMMMVIAPAKEK